MCFILYFGHFQQETVLEIYDLNMVDRKLSLSIAATKEDQGRTLAIRSEFVPAKQNPKEGIEQILVQFKTLSRYWSNSKPLADIGPIQNP